MKNLKDENISKILKLIAPGTPIRDGLENILRAKTRSFIINNRSRSGFKRSS